MPTNPALPPAPPPDLEPSLSQDPQPLTPTGPIVVIRRRTLDALFSPLTPEPSRGSPWVAHSPWDLSRDKSWDKPQDKFRDGSRSFQKEEPDSQLDPSQTRFVVLYDPGAYPLETGMSLSLQEIYFGLKLGSFYKGTLFYDQKDATQHQVIRQEGRLVLEPPSWRLDRYAENRES